MQLLQEEVVVETGVERYEVQAGEGTLTMATIFLTAFRAFVRGSEKRTSI